MTEVFIDDLNIFILVQFIETVSQVDNNSFTILTFEHYKRILDLIVMPSICN